MGQNRHWVRSRSLLASGIRGGWVALFLAAFFLGEPRAFALDIGPDPFGLVAASNKRLAEQSAQLDAAARKEAHQKTISDDVDDAMLADRLGEFGYGWNASFPGAHRPSMQDDPYRWWMNQNDGSNGVRESCSIRNQAQYQLPFMSYSGDDVIGSEDNYIALPCVPGYQCLNPYWANRHYRSGHTGWNPPAWRYWPGGLLTRRVDATMLSQNLVNNTSSCQAVTGICTKPGWMEGITPFKPEGSSRFVPSPRPAARTAPPPPGAALNKQLARGRPLLVHRRAGGSRCIRSQSRPSLSRWASRGHVLYGSRRPFRHQHPGPRPGWICLLRELAHDLQY